MKEIRILLVGGGSGGHVYPLIAVARSLREQASIKGIDLKLMLMGNTGFLARAAKENDISYTTITAGKLRRYFELGSIIDFFKIPVSLVQSFWYIFWYMPDAVFSKGGYDSVAPTFIARIFFIPVFTHESDSIPGLANLFIAKMADKVFLSFKTAEKHFESSKAVFTGNPTRKNIFQGDKNAAREYFNLREPRPTILVLGGSQGAKFINEVVTSSLVVMAQKFNIIHQCGETQFESVKKDVDVILKEGTQQYAAPIKVYYRNYPYFDENQLSLAYSLADVIISRAGAGSLFEIAQLGKPAIIVPITQSASNHQYLNAFEFSLSGGLLLEEANFNRESMLRGIELLLNPETYAKVSGKIKTFATPDASDVIASEIFKFLNI